MFITLPASPFVDDVSTLTAAVLNVWRINIGKSLDVVGGSEGVASTPATIIEIAGKGLLLSATPPEIAFAIATGSLGFMDGEWDATGGNTILGETHIADLQDATLNGTFDIPSGSTVTAALGSNVDLGGATTLTGGTKLKYSSRPVSRNAMGIPRGDTNWTLGQTTKLTLTAASQPGSPGFVELDLPHGATLTGVSVYVDPANGHGSVPTVTLLVKKMTQSTGSDATIASQVDTSGSAGAYDAVHTISVTGMTEVVDNTVNRYFAAVSADDPIANFVLIGARWTCTVTEVDEGA